MALTEMEWAIAGAFLVLSIPIVFFFIQQSNRNLRKKLHHLAEREKELDGELKGLQQSVELLRVELNEKWARLEDALHWNAARELEQNPVIVRKKR